MTAVLVGFLVAVGATLGVAFMVWVLSEIAEVVRYRQNKKFWRGLVDDVAKARRK